MKNYIFLGICFVFMINASSSGSRERKIAWAEDTKNGGRKLMKTKVRLPNRVVFGIRAVDPEKKQGYLVVDSEYPGAQLIRLSDGNFFYIYNDKTALMRSNLPLNYALSQQHDMSHYHEPLPNIPPKISCKGKCCY